MSSKALKKTQTPKLKKQKTDSSSTPAGSSSNISFSFQSVTGKQKHNLHFFDEKNGTEQIQKLFENLQDWSSQTWNALAARSKRNGFETIPLSEFKEDISDQAGFPVSKDTKILIFRFGDCRLACLKEEGNTPLLSVLGFDWDFSLYDHGS
jgi:hypothetical protein